MTQATTENDEYNDESEFRHEEQHLRDVVALIDSDIQSREERAARPTYGPDVRSADAVVTYSDERLKDLRAVRPNPFFGRIDYSEGTDTDVRTMYIGKSGVNIPDVPEGFILNHGAPLAALYYNPAAGLFKTPKGARHATVFLKRSLAIEDAQLFDIEDVLRLPTPDGIQIMSSRMLDERLSSPSSEYMSDAVQTLQPEQYEALAKTDSPVLILQGAAGSGKSIVGLQRIEFILSPHSDIGILDRPRPDRIIMFGPSQAFLKYISELLPGMDVPNVRQMTVSQWLLEKFSATVTLRGGEERVFNDLMNNRQRFSEAEINAHLFKGGLRMKRVLDSYVRTLTRESRQNIRRQASNLLNRLSLNMSAADFRARVDDAFSIRQELNAARELLIGGLADERARTAPRPPRRRNATRSQLVAASRVEVERELGHLWPRYDFRREYVRLMSGPDVIMRYSQKGDLSWNSANEICLTVPRNATGRSLGLTDLAAALYLDYDLNGFQSENFEHVVVDEAQDLSPLEIELMRMNSSNDSFTILGDLKQGLLPHRSITNWNQFVRLFERGRVTKSEMRNTYRNTKQITQYTNRILKGLHMRTTKTPSPYGRRGERPKLIRSRSAADMGKAIADAIKELRELGDVRSIAVLTKWESTAGDIVKVLRSENVEDFSRLSQSGVIESATTVSPVILTKGLEFDAVIVANAGKNNYNDTEFDRMLLYLACTRARHHLQLHWHGTRSPIVPDVERLAR